MLKAGLKLALVLAFCHHSFIAPISLLYHSTGIPISKRYSYDERMLKE
ncbi:hypothetical protein [Chitinophaga sp. YR573]|nr:hypothetical protein [Chitinophaga sp. YR573]